MVARMDKAMLEQWAKRLGELVRDGYAPPGAHVASGEINATTALSRELNMKQSTLQKHVLTMKRTGLSIFWGGDSVKGSIAKAAPVEVTVDDRIRERRLEQEVSSLKKREKELLDQVISATDYRSSVMGLTSERLDPSEIKPIISTSTRGETAILLLSDLHFGEFISREELEGLNAFDPAIAEARLRKVFATAAALLTKHWPGPPPERLIIALMGDAVSGALHPELMRTDKLRPMESVRAVSAILASGIDLLLNTVDCPIDIISVVGNHGRVGLIKPESKGVASESYDTLVSDFLEMHYKKEKRVTFYVPAGPDALVSIYNYKFLFTHGDRMSAGGGRGFVGAELPILRGFQKTHMDYAMRGTILHHVFCGHFHTPLSSALGTANGCLPGPSEYSISFRMRPNPPMQAFVTVHPEHFITQTRWIKPAAPDEGTLYDPPAGVGEVRPRFRVKAASIS